jgi:hypothetical protein
MQFSSRVSRVIHLESNILLCCIIVSMLGHIWYIKLDQFCVRYCRSNLSMITTKVCGDTFVFGPVCLWMFFVSVSIMEGTPWDRIEKKLRRDFVPTYIVDYSMWPIVQGLNFRYVPVQHQLLVVNLMCYFDDIFLSYVQHNSLPTMFQIIEDWWKEYLIKNQLDGGLDDLEAEEAAEENARRLLYQQELHHKNNTTQQQQLLAKQ